MKPRIAGHCVTRLRGLADLRMAFDKFTDASGAFERLLRPRKSLGGLTLGVLARLGLRQPHGTDLVSKPSYLRRPRMSAALDYLREGDTLAVWRLDCLDRSTKEILTIAGELHARSVGLRILAGTLSGDYQPTGSGKLFFTIMAAFAEFERDQIRMRTMAGLKAAAARGRAGGRPTVMDAGKLAAARARRERGESPARIAKALGVSRASVYRHLAGGTSEPGGVSMAASADPNGQQGGKQRS